MKAREIAHTELEASLMEELTPTTTGANLYIYRVQHTLFTLHKENQVPWRTRRRVGRNPGGHDDELGGGTLEEKTMRGREPWRKRQPVGGESWRTRRQVGINPGEDAEWGKTPCGGNRGGDNTEWGGGGGCW